MVCVIFNTERINKLILIKINHVSKQKVRYGHIYDRKCGLPQVKEELLNLDGRFCLVSVNQLGPGDIPIRYSTTPLSGEYLLLVSLRDLTECHAQCL
jgi:hypothetical protein